MTLNSVLWAPISLKTLLEESSLVRAQPVHRPSSRVRRVRRARVIKYKPHGMGFILREKRKFSRASRSFSLVDVFEKNEKKNKTTTVYRLVRARQVRRTVGVAGKKNTRAALAFDCTKLCRNIYIPRLVISCGCRVKFSNSSQLAANEIFRPEDPPRSTFSCSFSRFYSRFISNTGITIQMFFF